MEAKVDHFVTSVGGCGIFQVILSIFVYSAKSIGGWTMMMMTFAAYNPGWTCPDAEEKPNSNHLYANRTSPSTSTRNVPVKSGTNTSSTEAVCNAARSCTSALVFDPESSTIVSEWGLVCDLDWIPPLVISIQMVGVMLGSFFCGLISERMGRKVSLYFWLAISVVFNLAAALSTSWQMFATFRFFVGLSIGGNLSVSQMYALEFVTSKWRARLPGIPTWNISIFTFAICLYALKDWRHVHFASALASLIVFLTVFWTPESIRWQAVHGKTKEAKKTALRICRYNNLPPPSEDEVDFSFSEGTPDDKKATILHLFRKQLRKRTILVGIFYGLIGPMYYAIGFGIKALHGNFYLNFGIFALLPIPTSPTVWILSNRFGRRWACFIYLFLVTILSLVVVVVVFTVDKDIRGWLVTGIALLISCLIDLAWSVAVTFLAELFPTAVRATGFSFAFTVARISSILAPYIMPRNEELIYMSFLLLAVMGTVNCCVVLALPETRGKCLTDLVRQGDVKTVLDEKELEKSSKTAPVEPLVEDNV